MVGIDPDCDQSGVAIVDPETREIKARKLSFSEIVLLLQTMKQEAAEQKDGRLFKVVVEAGWLNKGNWHVSHNRYMSVSKAAEIGRGVGRNHQTGMLIEEISRFLLGLPTELQKPFQKCWKGKDGKITQEELQQVTGTPKLPRMNQDQRDAVLIAWVNAGLPLRRRRKEWKSPPKKKREGEYKGERYSVDTHARIHEHTRTDKQTDKKNTDPSFTVEVV